ncbi:MAG: magnesium transporter [Rhodobacteraceae bacterium]|nr:magnesium transporter [Paracoccaceae bacterium]
MSDSSTEPLDTQAREEDYELSPRQVMAITYAVERGDAEALAELLEPMHPADIADLLEQINAFDRGRLVRLMGDEFSGEILSELDDALRDRIIPLLPKTVLEDAVRELDSDDLVDLVEDLDAPEAILDALDDRDRAAVESALAYPEGSAGRLMQREVVMAPEHWTVGDAIDHMRNADHLPDQFYHMVLVDPRLHPIANVTLGRIMGAPRAKLLRDIAEEVFEVISVTQDEGDVAYAFNQYHLISAPVVDEDGRLVGVITIDDAMAVLDAEHEEDMLLMAGVSESSLSDSVADTVRARLPWLFAALAAGIAGAAVISQFDEAISAFVALAILMPIVAAMGGNAGTQTLTVTVRALATRDLTRANIMRVIRREFLVGLLNGTVFATVMGGLAAVWFDMPELGLIMAAALIINMLIAGLVGTMVPYVLDKLGADPALASGTFVATTTDMMGFFAFLGLASLVLL